MSEWRRNLPLHATTFMLWGLLASSAVFWGLRMSAPGAVAGGPVSAPSPLSVDTGGITRLLGATPAAAAAPAPALASRLSLAGVVAGRSRDGVALIALDGKPPKPYRVGAPVEAGLVLQAVEARRALLGPERSGPASFTLELPVPKRAEAGPAVRTDAPPRPEARGTIPTQTRDDGRNDAVGARTAPQ